MPSFKFLLEKLAWIFTIYIVGFYVSALFGGPLPFFKMILSIVFILKDFSQSLFFIQDIFILHPTPHPTNKKSMIIGF